MKKKTSRVKNPINVSVGRNLKYFIECNNISIQELADKLGIETDTVLRLLNGTNGMSSAYNKILLEEFNCDLNFIYGGISHSQFLTNQIEKSTENVSEKQARKSIMRAMAYLLDMLENMED